jgi:hypothetical protein
LHRHAERPKLGWAFTLARAGIRALSALLLGVRWGYGIGRVGVLHVLPPVRCISRHPSGTSGSIRCYKRSNSEIASKRVPKRTPPGSTTCHSVGT